MTIIPSTTPVPRPNQIFMAPTSPASSPPPPPPTSSAVPFPLPDRTAVTPASPTPATSSSSHHHPQPTLRLEIRSLSHPGATKFLSSTNASTLLSTAVRNVQTHLYTSPPQQTHCPPTRSVTVILRDIGGVAYTTGTELDAQHHKEIHFSLNYINSIPASRLEAEITGVLTHELVHCYQHNAQGSCPGGLIEGIADWVRLCCRLEPPHWKRETKGGKWDGGYQRTAYFLEYLERRFGRGTVRRVNEALRRGRYGEKEFWTGLLGRPVEQLWGDYVEQVEREEGREKGATGDLDGPMDGRDI
ncbi:peptidase of plants and bacteria-domain-containing protein [Coniochaeta sp. 2T2.1]|nr:peptidase of plants and bacteria-domain-containing protein [Coniochaeta sp. 2T2.1]